ncbi:MAG: hypothetical protein RIR26_1098 [Pseudomonadota bacterium]
MDKSQQKNSLVADDIAAIDAEANEESPSQVARRNTLLSNDVWTDGPSARVRKSKRVKTLTLYAFVGVLSFLLFLYLSFPFNVVKEVLVGKVNEVFIQSKLPVRMAVGNFGMKLPVGIALEDIQLNNVNDPSASLKIGKASVVLSVLSPLLGNLAADVRLEQSGGSVDVEVNQSIRGIIAALSSRSTKLPGGHLRLEFKKFELKPLIASALAFVRSGNNPALQTIQPFLRTEVSGLLSGKISLDVPTSSDSAEKIESDVDLRFNNAYFEMKDETLAIPRQDFSEAVIKAKLAKKSLEILPETKIISNDLGVRLSGRLSISDRMDVTDVKLNLGLTLKGKIEENFKTLLPVLLGCDLSKMAGGQMNVELSGHFSALTCS